MQFYHYSASFICYSGDGKCQADSNISVVCEKCVKCTRDIDKTILVQNY